MIWSRSASSDWVSACWDKDTEDGGDDDDDDDDAAAAAAAADDDDDDDEWFAETFECCADPDDENEVKSFCLIIDSTAAALNCDGELEHRTSRTALTIFATLFWRR